MVIIGIVVVVLLLLVCGCGWWFVTNRSVFVQ
jgi:hypothetical protein